MTRFSNFVVWRLLESDTLAFLFNLKLFPKNAYFFSISKNF